jgi:hypothetical protein
MQRLVYFIFIMPFTQSFAMESMLPGPSAPGNRIITVANVTHNGVTVQVCHPDKVDQQGDGNKIWIGSIRRGQLEVSPPTSSGLLHALVVRDTNEAAELARTDFAYPGDDDTLFQVSKLQGVVSVKQTDDPTKSPKDDKEDADALEQAKLLVEESKVSAGSINPIQAQSTQSLLNRMALPATGAVVLVLALLAAKKYAATE